MKYKLQLFTADQARLTHAPCVILGRQPNQARTLKAFLHVWMRPYEHQLCMDEGGSEELCDLQAVPLLMQQMLLGCQVHHWPTTGPGAPVLPCCEQKPEQEHQSAGVAE